jgi:osmotically-inducible protein OsmY
MRGWQKQKRIGPWVYMLAGLGVLLYAFPAWAQSNLGMSSGGSSGSLGGSFGAGGLGSTGGGLGSGGGLGLGGSSGGLGRSSGFSTSSLSGTGGGSFQGGGFQGGGFQGGGFQGGSRSGTYGNTGTTGGTFFPTPNTSTPFASYYRSPLTTSNTSTSGVVTIQQMPLGQPMYAVVTTTNTNAAGNVARAPTITGSGTLTYGASPAGSTVQAANPGPSDVVVRRSAVAGRVQTDVQGILARSSSLSNGRDIQVAADGTVLVLRGRVASERDRRLAEGLALMSPGVYEIRNELQVGPAPAVSSARR